MANIGKSVCAVLAVMAISTPTGACAHKDLAVDCHIEGVKYLGTELTDPAVCERFVAGLGQGSANIASVRIEVTQGGAINVRLSFANGDSRDMGMDVMDRPLRISDIDQLAQTVAGQL